MGLRVWIAGTIGLVLVAAVGGLAMRHASGLWADGLFTSLAAAVGAAVVGVSVQGGRRRGFWLGFAVFAGGYAAVAFGPWSDSARERLITRWVLDELAPRIGPDEDGHLTMSYRANSGAFTLRQRNWSTTADGVRRASDGSPLADYDEVGHAVIAWGLGLVGGLAGVAVAGRARRERGRDAGRAEA